MAHRAARHDPAVAGHPWLQRATDYCIQALEAEGEEAEPMALAFAFQVLDVAGRPEAEALIDRLGARIPEGGMKVVGGSPDEYMRPLDFTPLPDGPVRRLFPRHGDQRGARSARGPAGGRRRLARRVRQLLAGGRARVARPAHGAGGGAAEAQPPALARRAVYRRGAADPLWGMTLSTDLLGAPDRGATDPSRPPAGWRRCWGASTATRAARRAACPAGGVRGGRARVLGRDAGVLGRGGRARRGRLPACARRCASS